MISHGLENWVQCPSSTCHKMTHLWKSPFQNFVSYHSLPGLSLQPHSKWSVFQIIAEASFWLFSLCQQNLSLLKICHWKPKSNENIWLGVGQGGDGLSLPSPTLQLLTIVSTCCFVFGSAVCLTSLQRSLIARYCFLHLCFCHSAWYLMRQNQYLRKDYV